MPPLTRHRWERRRPARELIFLRLRRILRPGDWADRFLARFQRIRCRGIFRRPILSRRRRWPIPIQIHIKIRSANKYKNMKKITTERYLSAAVITMALAVSFSIVVKADNSEINLSPGQSWKGTIPAASKLSLEGRIVYARPAGANYLLELNINGKPVTSQLVNKGQSFKYQDGRTFAYKSGNDWMLFYSADMSANNSAAGGGYQVMTDPGQAYRYSWDVSALSRGSGQMDVEIKNVSDKYTIVGRLTSVAATTFPIPELGNCTSAAECKQYCDVSANISACAVFAEKNGMISKEEAAQAKEFADVLRGDGPGGCKTKDACESYCNGI